MHIAEGGPDSQVILEAVVCLLVVGYCCLLHSELVNYATNACVRLPRLGLHSLCCDTVCDRVQHLAGFGQTNSTVKDV